MNNWEITIQELQTKEGKNTKSQEDFQNISLQKQKDLFQKKKH